MKESIYFWGTVLLTCAVTVNAGAAEKFTTEKQKLGYAIGIQIGSNLKKQGITEIDSSALGEAVGDVLKGNKPQLSPTDMQAVMQAYQKRRIAEREAEGKAAKIAGDKFLAKNKKKKGVKVTKDGIQYEIIKAGTGKKPKPTDTVTVNYVGKLVNGKVFDSSIKRGTPATFQVKGVIKGWAEVLPMMKVGAKWHVVIPPELGYGDHGMGPIGPNETLIFDIELLSIKS